MSSRLVEEWNVRAVEGNILNLFIKLSSQIISIDDEYGCKLIAHIFFF